MNLGVMNTETLDLGVVLNTSSVMYLYRCIYEFAISPLLIRAAKHVSSRSLLQLNKHNNSEKRLCVKDVSFCVKAAMQSSAVGSACHSI